jgi:hypothetical protein
VIPWSRFTPCPVVSRAWMMPCVPGTFLRYWATSPSMDCTMSQSFCCWAVGWGVVLRAVAMAVFWAGVNRLGSRPAMMRSVVVWSVMGMPAAVNFDRRYSASPLAVVKPSEFSSSSTRDAKPVLK